MAFSSWLHKELDAYGPTARLAYGIFTTANTAAPTVLDQQGMAVTRTGVGAFRLAMQHAPKSGYYVVTLGKQFTTDAQAVIITAQSAANKTIDILVCTDGSANTAVETTGMTIHVQVMLRMEQ